MRDFGFNIYKALYELPEKPKEKEEKKKKDDEKRDGEKKHDDKRKDDEKRKDDKEKKEEKDDRDKKSDDQKTDKKDEEKRRDSVKDDRKSDHDSDEDDDFEDGKGKKKSDKDKRKRDRPKMYTKDRNLLLSFVYFDQTHCGYIFEKDIEDLIYTLGLSLSRAQVRKLVSKVISRDSLHYRKLTDKPKEEDFIVIDDSEKEQTVCLLAKGNKSLLPVFNASEATKKEITDAAENSEQSSTTDGKIIL